jgi:D-arabinose 1-dehydrogenase-like Zn-dependent alcohol dehydrogenase
LTARRILSLTIIFCGLGLAFSAFSFAALGRGGMAVLVGFGGLAIVGVGIAALPGPIRPPVVGWTPGPDSRSDDPPELS